MPSILCCPRRAAGTQGTLGRVSRHSRRRGRPSAPRAPPARWAPGAGNAGRRQGGPTGSRNSRGTWGVRSSRGGGGARPLRGAPSSLPAAPPPACCRDPGGGAGETGGPEQSLTPPRRAPRAPSLEASRTTSRGCAVASQQPSYSLPARRGRAPPPRHLRASGAPAVLLPFSPRRPARGPGSPRSPALDNALVKTAELFLTSPPPLLIKAPP